MRTPLVFAALAVSLLSATAAGAQAPDLTTARQIVDAHSQLPEFTPPGPPFKARDCMAGKKLLSIPVSSSIPFVDGIEASMQQVAKQVGFTFQQWKNQGRPTEWVQGVAFAINNKFDAVDLMAGIIPSGIGPQVADANKAGLKVFASHYSDTSQPADPAIAVTLKLPFHEVGQVIGAWIAMKTAGRANVLIIGSDDVVSTKPYAVALADTLDRLCAGGCKHRYVGVTVPEWSTKIGTIVRSEMLADPTITYIVPIYDSMSQFVLPALTLTGNRGKVKIATFNGTPFIIDMLRRGDVEMDVGESLGWIARATLDGYMRNLCGMPVSDTLGVPLFIFSAANAKTAGVPATFDQGYGDKHVAGFGKLWSLE